MYIVFIRGADGEANYRKDHYGGLFNVFAFNVSLHIENKNVVFMEFLLGMAAGDRSMPDCRNKEKRISETLKNQEK